MQALNLRALLAITVLSGVLAGPGATADELQIRPDINNAAPGERLFVNGLRPGEVRARFGAPDRRLSPVGEPPISAWIYPDMTVYFEHDLALHAVLHRDASQQIQEQ
ncbi:MAG: hypothetical protein ACP5DC_02865 [Halothiobacillaceae bacterium]